ncbi:hypothetical protein AB0918_24620 [Streptomyces sp. NPDC006864]|uniref:hypothetical protein n=1 Tax=Streptomyces sp. NPDC006864 TaxID=3154780 RepID=UPI00345262BB
MSRDTTFSRLPSWAQGALRTAIGSQSVLRGIARAQRDSGALLLQILYREKRALATVVQYPVQDIQDAYDKAAQDMPPGDVVCYFVIATEPSLRRAEAAGVPYMRAYHGVHVSGAILRLPVSLWTESADA